jgi:hypothetical protein
MGRIHRDGLVGLWGYDCDAAGNLACQYFIMRKSLDMYLCQTYAPDGTRLNCVLVPRAKLLKARLYGSEQALDRALGREKPAPQWPPPYTGPNYDYVAMVRALKRKKGIFDEITTYDRTT